MEPCSNDANLRDELDRDRVVLGHRQIVPDRLVATEHRDCRAHDIDRRRVFWGMCDEVHHTLRQLSLRAQRRRERIQFTLGRKSPMP
jgi:hypothetical protein